MRRLNQELIKLIDEELSSSLAGTLADLISIESHSQKDGCEKGVAAYLEKRLQEIGCDVEIREVAPGRPNVIAGIGNESMGPTLMINAHLDTVSAEEWSEGDPFQAVVKGGRVYGRGAVDVKGSITAVLIALTALKKVLADKIKGRLVFTGVVGEEGSASLGTYEVLRNGPIPDMAVVCEPTDLDIYVTQKGSANFNLILAGRSAHASKPGLGINAVEVAALLLEYHRHSFAATCGHLYDSLLGSPTLTPVSIKGGGDTSIVPSRCEVLFNCRYPVVVKLEQIQEYLTGLAEKVSADFKGIRYDLERFRKKVNWRFKEKQDFEALPFLTSPDATIVRKLEQTIKMITGREPQIAGASFWSDAGLLGGVARVPTVIFGPGKIDVAHGPAEYVEVKEVLDAAKIFACLVGEFFAKE